jgi:Flp pilus assembly protein CpaB
MTYKIRSIVIAIVLAALAALLTGLYVSNYKRSVQEKQANVEVVDAAKDIPAGMAGADLVAQKLLEPRTVARDAVVPGTISRPGEVASLVVTQPILAGEQVSARRFGPLAARGIRTKLTGNRRAIQVAGDQHQLLGGTLKAGDRVDVVGSIKYKVSDVVGGGAGGSSDVDRVASRVVLRNLEVLRTSVGEGLDRKLAASSDSHWAILAVTDNQAQKLFFVVKNGDWSLQLRPVLEAADSPGSVETIESVLGDGLRAAQFRQLYTGRAAG